MQVTDVLVIFAIFLIMAIMILGFVYFYMLYKNKMKKETKEENAQNSASTSQYTKLSVFDFMQFDKIEDNMIVQDNGTRYLMVVSCEGINYDLMSNMEKTSVELGFIQFLNTLRFPIQLYIQTRTVNIEQNILTYKNKLNNIKADLDKKQKEYNYIIQNGEEFTTKQKQDAKLELLRLQNLYDYGTDVVSNIEQTSKNQNVLKKSYYVVIPYYIEEVGNDIQDGEEKRNMIFAELYTRAQAIVRTLFMSNVKAKIMNSTELAELLYIAYNRDESEVYGLDRAILAGYDELYSTAPDVLDKRMQALDEKIEKEAFELARNKIDEVKTAKQKKLHQKEKDFETLVREMAERLLKENKRYIGKDIAEEAIEKLNNTKEKEEKVNEAKTKKKARKSTSAK